MSMCLMNVIINFDYFCFSSEASGQLEKLLLEKKNGLNKIVIGEPAQALCTQSSSKTQINRKNNKPNRASEETSNLKPIKNTHCKRKRKTNGVNVKKNSTEIKDVFNPKATFKQVINKNMLVQSGEPSNAENKKKEIGCSIGATNEESNHTDTKLKPILFDCTVCGKQFREKSHLATHSRAHVDIRSFKCNECGNSFKTKTNLLFHMKTHEEAPYICKKCNKTFPERKVLMRHMRVVHR